MAKIPSISTKRTIISHWTQKDHELWRGKSMSWIGKSTQT